MLTRICKKEIFKKGSLSKGSYKKGSFATRIDKGQQEVEEGRRGARDDLETHEGISIKYTKEGSSVCYAVETMQEFG